MKKLTLAALSVLWLLSSAGAQTSPGSTAWVAGERLEYKVFFGFFNAGTSVFTAGPEQTIGGRRTVQFKSVLQSAPRFFYSIYDEATSTCDPVTYVTQRYEKVQRERDENSRNITVFNHANRTAVRTEDGRAHPPIEIARNPMDVLSAIYYVRSQSLAVGRTLSIPVHDGKRDYTMKVVVRSRERIRTDAGAFECLKVEPTLYQSDGTVKRRGQMTLWLTDDARHIPVRIRMGLPFGSIVADLKTMSGTRP